MNTICNSSSSPSDLAADHSQTPPSLEEVRQRFQGDRFATENGAVIDAIGEGYAKCSMELSDSHRNAAGAVMGGAILLWRISPLPWPPTGTALSMYPSHPRSPISPRPKAHGSQLKPAASKTAAPPAIMKFRCTMILVASSPTSPPMDFPWDTDCYQHNSSLE